MSKIHFGVYVGRFQPLHNAHLALMQEALGEVETLIVVLGSAKSARTPKNPFTDAERAGMIWGALGEAGVNSSRVRFAAVPDLYNLAAWADAVRKVVLSVTGANTNIAVVGHDKDESSAYLRAFPKWRFMPTRIRSDLSATSVRRALFDGDFERVEASVPPNVAQFLRGFTTTPEFAALREEDAFLREERARWAEASEPPVFVAAHGLVISGNHVLLTRRADFPGRGLLMLPGGWLHPKRTLAASLRLRVLDQTKVELPEPKAQPDAVFDHPERTLLGREIAYVFAVELAERTGGEWFALEDALARPEAFYADHHRILEVMLERGQAFGNRPSSLGPR